MTSRVIVKNLPLKCTEEKLKEQFSACGEVTDVRLMRTRSGASRKFGFVGYNSVTQAQDALKCFNKTYIGSSKIEVDLAKPYGDQSLDRPWSKYSKQKVRKLLDKEVKGHEPVSTVMGEALQEFEGLKEDPKFLEFMDAHMHTSKVRTWANNTALEDEKGRGKSGDGKGRGKSGDGKEHCRSTGEKHGKSTDEEKSEGEIVTVCGQSDKGCTPVPVEREAADREGADRAKDNPTTSQDISDLDYLKTKIVRCTDETVEASGDLTESGDNSSVSCDSDVSGSEVMQQGQDSTVVAETLATTPYTIKMLGLPFRASEAQIHTFFHPLKVMAVRFTKDVEGRPSGRAYADFRSERDLKAALKRNRDCISHRYIELFRDEPRAEVWRDSPCDTHQLKPWELKAAMKAGAEEEVVEDIAESGRIFVRNLPFSTCEEDLNEAFCGYGPLTEVTMPLDKTTNKPMGLAFVTFMLPEHAAKAYQELDGQIFQGRLLHLLPARARRSHKDSTPAQVSSFKKKKASKLRSEAGSGHNWNSLFLGANAVVDVMAGKYSTDKSDILDPSSKGSSAAVRVALGETQIVRETREFLQSHGVKLEVFEQKHPKRSKTVIIVKNLPSGTVSLDIVKLFEPFGTLIQVILPPAAISAVVEFAEASHAKKAFSKLAYTNFRHLPLYLEWAPLDILDKQVQQEPSAKGGNSAGQDGENGNQEDRKDEDGGEGENTGSVFVKNLSFSTKEATLTELFSRVGDVRSVSIARKKNPKDPATPLSMGFGFVEFGSHEVAMDAIKQLQHSKVDGHLLELKLSHRRTQVPPRQPAKKAGKLTKQKSAKILVRNIPFEASIREVKDLFSTFGSLKMVRLPKKLSADGGGEHRGFGFVEFSTKQDAKSAFDALSYSTHLYGRRLVLEWAEQEESLDAIRKRTAEHFHGIGGNKPKRTKSQEQTLLATLEKSVGT